MHVRSYILILLACFSMHLQAQKDSTCTYSPKKLKAVVATEAVLYAGSMTGLYHLWYKQDSLSRMHLFNDNNEWLQMDKMGHMMTSYYVGKIGYEALQLACISEKKSIWYGGMLGLAYLTGVEVLDGISANWGFSLGDMVANTTGAGLFIGQQLGWHEQRMLLKFSYHETNYAAYRPSVLGSRFQERMVKDYNGQTYWLSANIHSFLKNKETHFPRWLSVAVGYSAAGMITGQEGTENTYNPPLPYFNRYRQFLLSLDIDLTRLPVKNKALKTLCQALGFIKFPMPALEINTSGDPLKLHYLYF